MPYHWQDSTHLELTPHRSLPPSGFAVVIAVFFTLIMIPVVSMIGTKVLWGLLPFVLAALAALWWGLRRSYRDGMILERLTIDETDCALLRDGPGDAHAEWHCNPFWVRVQMHERGGPVTGYVTLSGNGREVEIGAFLSEDERRVLYTELVSAFSRTR